MKSCVQINKILIRRYDIDLLGGSLDYDHIRSVYEHYSEQRNAIRLLGESATNTLEYSKAYLISEAARLILREIAPKRINRKKKKETQ